MSGRSMSLQSRLILVILLGVVTPLAAAAFWLTRTTRNSGEALLRARLEESLGDAVFTLGEQWIRRRSDLLDLAQDPGMLALAREGQLGLDESGRHSESLRQSWNALEGVVDRAVLRDRRGDILETFTRVPGPGVRGGGTTGSPMPVRIAIHEPGSGEVIGSLEAAVELSSLLPGGLWWPGVGGSLLALFAGEDGTPLLPMPMEPALLDRDRFEWRGEEWLAVRHRLEEPPLVVALAAPVGAFTEPFSRAARQGVLIFATVLVLCVAMTMLLTKRMTGPLEELAGTADLVATGELEQRVAEKGPDEIRRVGRAFNAMTASLRDTLRKLARQEAAVAVGEFAASLAHEVRNPLTAIRLDLERAQERSDQEGAHALVARALAEIERLDSTVSGSLAVARSGNLELEPVDLTGPLEAAAHAAEPEFDSRGAELEPVESLPEIWVRGDKGALEQLFLNLLRNAAEALTEGGRAWIHVDPNSTHVRVSVRDDGPGIPLDIVGSVLEPFYSTKPDGTGLGLSIATRIARAHGGDLTIESGPEGGTTVLVVLPRHIPRP